MFNSTHKTILIACVIICGANLYKIHTSLVQEAELIGFIKGASKCVSIDRPAQLPLVPRA